MSKCYANARSTIQDLASRDPAPASVSFITRGSQCNTELISNLCAMPDFFIEELLTATSEEVAASTSEEIAASSSVTETPNSESLELGAKRGRASESAAAAAGPKPRGKK